MGWKTTSLSPGPRFFLAHATARLCMCRFVPTSRSRPMHASHGGTGRFRHMPNLLTQGVVVIVMSVNQHVADTHLATRTTLHSVMSCDGHGLP